MQTQLLTVVGVTVLVLVGWVVIMLRHIVLVPPNRIGVMSGRKAMTADGRTVGYRIVSGRALRLPIIEVFDLLAVAPELVHVNVPSVYFERGEQGSISATLTLAWARGDDLHNAVERFLGRSTEDVAKVVREVVAGTLRELAANTRRDKLHENLAKASDQLRTSLRADLGKLGLDVDAARVVDQLATDAGDPLEARLRDAGILDIAITTELACDVATDAPAPDGDALAAAGTPSVETVNGRMTLRWASSRVPEDQLVAGARLLAAARTGAKAYR